MLNKIIRRIEMIIKDMEEEIKNNEFTQEEWKNCYNEYKNFLDELSRLSFLTYEEKQILAPTYSKFVSLYICNYNYKRLEEEYENCVNNPDD